MDDVNAQNGLVAGDDGHLTKDFFSAGNRRGNPDNNSWNGEYYINGSDVPDGTYYWILDLGTGSADGLMSGYVEVLR